MDEEYHMSEEERINLEIEKEEKRKKGKKIALIILFVLLGIAVVFIVLTILTESQMQVRKPVLYLYPETRIEVSVELDFSGKLMTTYPKYSDGWIVTAEPDGTITDTENQIYNYLYWEGLSDVKYDMSEGFCIKGSDTAEFLEYALSELGLTRREANEFIVYWLPFMEGNEYNVISFQKETYTDDAKLKINPCPDTIIRVFMAWYGSGKPVEMKEQELTAPERRGFTVVEWGGSEIR